MHLLRKHDTDCEESKLRDLVREFQGHRAGLSGLEPQRRPPGQYALPTLVQMSLVYVNTLMIQQVLTESAWHSRLNANDLRGITPLIYSHVNPYGSFRLDLNARLPIDPPRFGPQSLGTQLLLNYDEQAG